MPRAKLIAAAHDHNWFYSTLAQSTLAIVALAGGFLVARLIALREKVGGSGRGSSLSSRT